MTIIFDLDGTLVDTGSAIADSINYVRHTLYGLPPLTTDEIAALINEPGRDLPIALYGTARYEEAARKIFENHYARRCLQNAPCYPGIETLLHTLRQAGHSLHVATNAPTRTSKLILANHGIETHFDSIVGADLVDRPKPAPDMLHRILDAYPDHQTWMVGDSLKDAQAAQQAGIPMIYARWGYGHVEPEDSPPDLYLANEPLALIDILTQGR
jgi:phosphoglycolate phosphatase